MIEVALFTTGLFGFVFLIEQWPKFVQRRKLEQAALRMWAVLEVPCTYRRAGPGDDAVMNRLDEAVDETAELEREFTRAGDVILDVADLGPIALRVFLHREQRMLAYVSSGKKRASIAIESYTAGEEFVTHRDRIFAQSPFALGPFSHHQYWPSATPIERLVNAHRIYARFDEPERLTRIETLDDALRQFQQFADKTAAWRCAQDPDTLLSSDVRALLGEKGFSQRGAAWVRRFKKKRAKLPVARVRRPEANNAT